MRILPAQPREAQLRLFDPPAPAVPSCTRRAGRLTTLRVLGTILALGLASGGVFTGSFAAWTAQTTNPGNAVAAGTLTMSNSKAATALFDAANVKPGDTGSSTVVVQNTGTIPMSVRLTQDSLVNGFDPTSLGLKVHDDTRNWCYWPTSQAGACPATYGAWNATETLAALPLAATDGAPQWPAGQAHTFTISWELAASSPNSDQGKSGTFRLVWDGLQ